MEKLDAALEKAPQLLGFSAIWLLRNLDQAPEAVRTAVHHNAGGHVNHSMFWRAMKPGAAREPEGRLRQAINRNFGSVAAFKARFEEAGAGLFGSGWVWLAQSRLDAGKLEGITSSGHDHPLMQDRVPLLLNDLWEHAYYLRYESRRPDYLKAWWSVVDWKRRRAASSAPTPPPRSCGRRRGDDSSRLLRARRGRPPSRPVPPRSGTRRALPGAGSGAEGSPCEPAKKERILCMHALAHKPLRPFAFQIGTATDTPLRIDHADG